MNEDTGKVSAVGHPVIEIASPRVSVVIRTRDEGARLGQVLRALLGQDYDEGLEILVVDSGSTDGTLAIARSAGARLIEISSQDFTFGRALNVGSEAAQGEFLVNLSGHAVPVQHDYLKQLTAPFEHAEVWATFGRDVPWPDCCPSQARDITDWFPGSGVERPGFFSNANACLRRQAWESFPFDEALSGAEDIQWAKQVRAAGYRIVYVPTAMAFHSHTSAPCFAFTRAYRETRALKEIEPSRARYGLGKALRFWLGISALDYRYAWRHRSPARWYGHIPIYRGFQAWGLYRGSR
jgi:rhamnosyltransferase